jgi:hypothetical protein
MKPRRGGVGCFQVSWVIFCGSGFPAATIEAESSPTKKLNTSGAQQFIESLNYNTNNVLEPKTRTSCGSGILAAIYDASK